MACGAPSIVSHTLDSLLELIKEHSFVTFELPDGIAYSEMNKHSNDTYYYLCVHMFGEASVQYKYCFTLKKWSANIYAIFRQWGPTALKTHDITPISALIDRVLPTAQITIHTEYPFCDYVNHQLTRSRITVQEFERVPENSIFMFDGGYFLMFSPPNKSWQSWDFFVYLDAYPEHLWQYRDWSSSRNCPRQVRGQCHLRASDKIGRSFTENSPIDISIIAEKVNSVINSKPTHVFDHPQKLYEHVADMIARK